MALETKRNREIEEEREADSPILRNPDSSFRNGVFAISNAKPKEVQLNATLDSVMEDEIGSGHKEFQLRRDSVCGRISNDGLLDSTNRQLLTVESDKHRSIVWERKTVDGFLRFMEKIYDFTKSYDQRVPNLYTHISEAIQQSIAGFLYMHLPVRYKTIKDVYRVDVEDLSYVALIMFAPKDLVTFNEQLYLSCKYYAVKMFRDDFEGARVKLYVLRQKFKERYDFLQDGAMLIQKTDAIPAVSFKSGGLLESWMVLTPEQTRETFQQMLQKAKYNDLSQFLQAYFKLVDDTNEKSEQRILFYKRVKPSSPPENCSGIRSSLSM